MYTRNKLAIRGLQAFGMFAINFGIVYAGWRQQNLNYEFYKNLPEDKQREVYNNCALQKVGSCADGISAIQERILQSNSEALKNLEPLRPYSPPK